jgi:hypothetical protein
MSIEDIFDVGLQHPGGGHGGMPIHVTLCVQCDIIAAEKGSAWCRHCHPRHARPVLPSDKFLDRWRYVQGVS